MKIYYVCSYFQIVIVILVYNLINIALPYIHAMIQAFTVFYTSFRLKFLIYKHLFVKKEYCILMHNIQLSILILESESLMQALPLLTSHGHQFFNQ